MAVTDTRYDVTGAARYARGVRQRRWSRGLELQALRRALRGAGGSVLDAPCGTGRVDGVLRAQFRDVTGLDRSAFMIGHYLHADPARRAIHADVLDAPVPAASFDWVVCHRLFHHLRDDGARVALLTALARLTRLACRRIALYLWLEGPLNLHRRSWRQSIGAGHLRTLAARAGLSVERIHRCAGPFQPKAIAVLCPVHGA